jgi:hypothetical protein
MVLNRVWLAAIGAMVLAWSGVSAAQQYRADEVLNLDLSSAVLSPKPLGPPTSFTQGPLDVTIDRGKATAQGSAELVIDPKTVPTSTVRADSTPAAVAPATRTALKPPASSRARVAHARAEVRTERPAPHKPRALMALHGRNPMEAQARDTSIQVWPCRSGGICNWKR